VMFLHGKEPVEFERTEKKSWMVPDQPRGFGIFFRLIGKHPVRDKE
jgi:hypothetical protein